MIFRNITRLLFGAIIAVGASCAVAPSLIAHAQQVPVPQVSGPLANATSGPVTLPMTGGQNSVWFDQDGTPGPVDVWGSNDSSHLKGTQLNVLDSSGATQAQPFTGTNKVYYQISPVGFAYISVFADATWSGQTSTVNMRGSASIARVGGVGGTGAPGPTGPSGPPGTTGPSGPPGSPGAGGTCNPAATAAPASPTYACIQSSASPIPQIGFIALGGTPMASFTNGPVNLVFSNGTCFTNCDVPGAIQIPGYNPGLPVCEGFGVTYWGTDSTQAADPKHTVQGQSFNVECGPPDTDNELFSINTDGDVGAKGTLALNGIQIEGSLDDGSDYHHRGIQFSGTYGNNKCDLSQLDNDGGETFNGIMYHTPSPAPSFLCTPVLNSGAVASAGPLCASPDPANGTEGYTGYYDVVGCPGGGGSGVSSINCTGLASCAPNATPTVYVPTPFMTTSAGAGTPAPCDSIVWSSPNTFTISNTQGCTGGGGGVTTVAVQPTACVTPSQSATSGNVIVYIPVCGGGGGGITLTSPIPTNNPTTQAGGIQITGPIAIGPAPSPVNSYVPNAIDISSGSGSVIYTRIGTSSSSVIGVAAYVLGISLSPLVGGQMLLAIDQNGNLAANNAVAAPNLYATNAISGSCGSSYISSALYDCTGGSDQGEVVLGGPGSQGVAYCQLDWNRVVAGYLSFPSCPVDLAASTKNNGEITCSLSGTASCSGTATVRSGAKCTASYEENDTTITPLTDLLPLQVHTASTTLTVYMDTSASLTGTLAANYWCP